MSAISRAACGAIRPIIRATTRPFGVTGSIPYEPPYDFARRISTLDRLTAGRLAWNVVTGYLDSAARGMGNTKQPTHDVRYDIAEDFMDVMYKLWEGSWEAKQEDLQRYGLAEGALALMSGWSGIDVSQLKLEERAEHVSSQAIQGALNVLCSRTVKEWVDFLCLGGASPLFVIGGR